MQIFGSDGFRCKFGEKYMTPEFIYDFANSIGDYCINKSLSRPILIARDTRSSGVILEDLISAILQYKGLKTVLCGIIPTPGLSAVLNTGNFSIGIMITASHNPHYDNGIKLFNSDGFKLEESIEAEIERGIMEHGKSDHVEGHGFEGKTFIDGSLIYSNYVANYFPVTEVKDSILVDCSNGACSYTVKENLKNYNNLHFIHDTPNGKNINLGCGALEAENLLSLVRSGNHDYGVAFDGDGDRSVFVSSDYGVIESEKLLCLFYQLLEPTNNSRFVISTEICNLALSHNLRLLGANLIETEVGDRFVSEKVRNMNAVIGAEPSGHYYFPSMSKSMDGLLGFHHFLKLIELFGKELPEQFFELKHYDRVRKDLSLDNSHQIDIDNIKKALLSEIDPNEEKLVIRRSMWDPVLRVYYDYAKTNRFNVIETVINDLLPD